MVEKELWERKARVVKAQNHQLREIVQGIYGEGFPGGWGLGLRLGAACSDLSGLLGLGLVWRLQAAHRTQKE